MTNTSAPSWYAVTRRFANARPSRWRVTWYSIGCLTSPPRMKCALIAWNGGAVDGAPGRDDGLRDQLTAEGAARDLRRMPGR